MSEHSDERKRKIAELEAELRALWAAEDGAADDATGGTANVSGTVRGAAVGVNYGTRRSSVPSRPSISRNSWAAISKA